MGYAADTYAKITREQYQDWKARFYPKQQELMELATNGQLLREQLGRVDENNANALRSAQQATANRNARMGVATTTNANDNSSSLNTSLAVAAAENGTRRAAEERNLSILAGSNARSYTTGLTDNVNS